MTSLATLPTATQRLVAEGLGTFFLVIVALLSPSGTTFALVGLMLAAMVVAIGKVSGSQINPAVTTSLIVSGQVPLNVGLMNMVAQVIGAVVAIFLAVGIRGSLSMTAVHVEHKGWFWLVEFLGTFLFAFTVNRAVISKAPTGAAAFAIGVALAIAIAIAGASSGGVINPAIAISLMADGALDFGSGLLYIVAPLIGGALAGALARYLSTPAELRGEG
ncbi:aquaporin [Deinococcus sp.]|uniref:aquaporin n=1 Tax=Deinococcus sp. TaxID=47478 RepID=UPI003CC68DAF